MSDRRRLKRKVSFRITEVQAREFEKMQRRGMNPSIQFRNVFDKMLREGRKR